MRFLPKLKLLTAATLLAACSGSDTPSERTGKPGVRNPTGFYLRSGKHPVGVSVSGLPTGNWVAETTGGSSGSPQANPCGLVAVGSMVGHQLIASSDLNLQFAGEVKKKE